MSEKTKVPADVRITMAQARLAGRVFQGETVEGTALDVVALASPRGGYGWSIQAERVSASVFKIWKTPENPLVADLIESHRHFARNAEGFDPEGPEMALMRQIFPDMP